MRENDAEDLRDVEAVLDGDEEAYARLVERHGPAVAKQMRNFSRYPLTAEELAQDVFVEAYLSLGKFRAEAPFRHWIARIATLVGYKYWKKRGRAKKLVSLSEAPDLPAPEKVERDPAAAAELLHELLATLPPADRLALTLMYLEKCSQEEIAGRMGSTRVMVAVRLYRAKRKLRELGEKEPWKGRLEWMFS
ncbi:MAG: RNA polymerase sigma factor [Planctomycetota bacterium]|jgi:RNA polymerase sigma-70 factor (ECF subfamily)|nr:RNA polymerase sigma factor [Planctomycetota bacterium]